MSAIGGIVGINRASVNAEDLVVLEQALNDRGPDGGNTVRQERVAIVYRAFHTNRHSRKEEQPLVDATGHILAWDGRLDNREELLDLLDDQPCDDTDASIVLAAFKTW